MGFFGSCVDSNEFEMDIPDAYSLQFLQACLDLEDSDEEQITTLYVQPANEEHGFILCHLTKRGQNTVSLNHVFGPEDSPISLWTTGRKVHLTGTWKWELSDSEIGDDECGHDFDESDAELEEDSHSVKEGSNPNDKKTKGSDASTKRTSEKISTMPSRQSVVTEKPKPVVSDNGGPKANELQSKKDVESSSTTSATKDEDSISHKAKKLRREQHLAAKAVKEAEIPAVVTAAAPAVDQVKARKRWNVKPVDDEGVLVPTPKQLRKTSGILMTDYIVGKGIEPKLGSKIKVTYEGCFPDGTVFDANLKRKKPFVFRKGTAQVIPGLDMGLEGMRVGGSREIVIPPELGYGADGMGPIPGNQTLVFRVSLIGVENRKLSGRS